MAITISNLLGILDIVLVALAAFSGDAFAVKKTRQSTDSAAAISLSSVIDQLTSLSALRDKGILSPEELAEKKEALMKSYCRALPA